MRGEGNHKIPGSFAPENMEKTGAERVKYSLACQYEDAIPIKFVSYVQKCPTVLCTFAVALRKESVDRNMLFLSFRVGVGVALRKESVDRNCLSRYLDWVYPWSLSARRAWIEMMYVMRLPRAQVSLSARRAWIEIFTRKTFAYVSYVALRKESVDRNHAPKYRRIPLRRSLSARRAWIEIGSSISENQYRRSRSPQGERG